MSHWKFKVILQGKFIGLSSSSNEGVLKPFYDQLKIISIKQGDVSKIENIEAANLVRRNGLLRKIKPSATLNDKIIELPSEPKTQQVIVIAKQGRSYFLFKYGLVSSSQPGFLNLFTKYPPIEFFKTAYNKKELFKQNSIYYDKVELCESGLFKVGIIHIYEEEEIINEEQDFIVKLKYFEPTWIYVDENGKFVSPKTTES